MMLQHTEEQGSNGGWVVLAFQNEFTEIFIYNFFEGFCRGGDEFYTIIFANVELRQIQGLVGPG